MPDEPITPHAAPLRDGEGRLTYIGEDGRRYIVAAAPLGQAGAMASPAACLFDLDGLLLDTEPLHSRAWREAAARFARQLSEAELLELRGRRRGENGEQVRRWIAELGGEPPSVEELLAVQQPIARRLLGQAPAMPGAQELVARCGELGIPAALVTSSSRSSLAVKCAGHPWLAEMDPVILGDDPELAAGKPAPDPFLLAARRLGVAAEACWAFEDSPAGARSAAAAGCRVHVLVPAELAPERVRDLYDPRWVFLSSLSEVRLEGGSGWGSALSGGG
jgi:pseudouridine-5'-monophosphatase